MDVSGCGVGLVRRSVWDVEATVDADVRVGGDAYGVGVFEVDQCYRDCIGVG